MILSFHFHLGILILVDTLDWYHQAFPVGLGSIIDIEACRLSSTRGIVTLINLMLSQSDTFAGDDPTSIILKDPYPEHTRNGLSRAAYSVLKLYSSQSLPKQVAEIMASSLFAGLEVLRQISYSASESLHDLYVEYSKCDLLIRRRQPVAATNLTVVPSAYEAALTPELFEEATFKQLDLAGEDPFLVNKTIGRHETHEIPDDFAWFDLDGADLTFMNQDWSFQVSIAQKASRVDTANLSLGLFLQRMSQFDRCSIPVTGLVQLSNRSRSHPSIRAEVSGLSRDAGGISAKQSAPNLGPTCRVKDIVQIDD